LKTKDGKYKKRGKRLQAFETAGFASKTGAKSRQSGTRHEEARFERREKSENIGEGIGVRRWVRGQ